MNKKYVVTFIRNNREVYATPPLSKCGAEFEARQWERHFLNSYNREECALAKTIEVKEL